MSKFIHMRSIPEMFRFFQLEQPVLHPLVSVIDFSKVKEEITEDTKVSSDFYSLICKNYNRNNVKYGRKLVDFTDGSLICMSPNQILEMDNDGAGTSELRGWGLFFHPDLVRGSKFGEHIKEYTFLSYEVSEALHLSEKEKQVLQDCVQKIEEELHENLDIHSQAILVSGIEMLLNYCSRFYGRQFITRKSSNNAVVAQVEKILADYFKDDHKEGLPTVKYLAEKVHLSANYLSDLLKKETGRNTKDHIHYFVIEEAKNILLNTDLSVGEIAYSLGFEYPQHFNKLFKQKTNKTPIEFRNMN